MKKVTFVLLILVFSIKSFSQLEYSTIDGSFHKPEKMALLKDSVNNFCIYYKELGRHYFFTIDSSGGLVEKNEFSFDGYKLNYYGGFVWNKQFVNLFAKDKHRLSGLIAYCIPVNGEEPIIVNIELPEAKKMAHLAIISNSKSFHHVSILKKEKQVRVVELNSLKPDIFYFQLSKFQKRYFKNKRFYAIKPNQEFDLEKLSYDRKIYLTEENRVVVSIDNENFLETDLYGNTRMLVMDKKSEDVREVYFSSPTRGYSNNYNSFYYNNLLYKFSITRDKVEFYISDCELGKVVKGVSYSAGNLYNMITGEVNLIIDSDTAVFDGEYKQKRTLRKMSDGKLGVGAIPADSGLLFVVGSYKQLKYGSVPFPAGIMLTYSPFLGPENETFFYVYVDTGELSIKKADISYYPFFNARDFILRNSSIYTKEENYSLFKLDDNSQGIFKTRDYTYIACFDYLRNKIKLFRLPD